MDNKKIALAIDFKDRMVIANFIDKAIEQTKKAIDELNSEEDINNRKLYENRLSVMIKIEEQYFVEVKRIYENDPDVGRRDFIKRRLEQVAESEFINMLNSLSINISNQPQ